MFSPDGNGTKDDTTVSASLSDLNGVADWSIDIADGTGVVRTFTGTDLDPSEVWDGTDAGGSTVADGGFTATLSATDIVGNAASDQVAIAVDLTAPAIGAVGATEPFFSPNGDGAKDETTFEAEIIEAHPGASWSITVTDQASQGVNSFSGSGTSVGQPWDGTDSGGQVVGDDTYTATLSVVDAQGLQASALLEIVTVDTLAPTISGLTVSEPFFSPNGDGVKDTTTISANLDDVNGLMSWTLEIGGASFGGTNLNPSPTWRPGAGDASVGDGAYSATLRVTDPAGNESVRQGPLVTVDTILPSGQLYIPDHFSGAEPLEVTATLSEPVDWQLGVSAQWGEQIAVAEGTGSAIEVEWDGTDQIGESLRDGTYQATLGVADAAGNQAELLDATILDSTPPQIARLSPHDRSTRFTTEAGRVSAVLVDGGSGLDAQTVRLLLLDETGGSTVELSPLEFVEDGSETLVQADTPLFTAGHIYRVGVVAGDRVGNEAARWHAPLGDGGGFLVSTIQASDVVVESPPSPCTLGPASLGSPSREAVCPNGAIWISESQVSATGVRTPGGGVLGVSVSLEELEVATVLGTGLTVPLSAYSEDSPELRERVGLLHYGFQGTGQMEETAAVQVQDAPLPEIRLQVPAWWDNAHLRLAPHAVVPDAFICPSPDLTSCRPDPLVFPDYWRPDRPGRTIARCDDVLLHDQDVLAPPGVDFSLGVAVDQSRFQPADIELQYSLTSDVGSSVGSLGPDDVLGGSYTFTIAGSLLQPGMLLEYGFVATGEFLDPACASWEAAVSPSSFGHAVLVDSGRSDDYATAVATASDRLMWDLKDPGGRDELCARFSSPTPCEVPEESNKVVGLHELQAPEGGGFEASQSGDGPQACRLLADEESVFWLETDEYTRGTAIFTSWLTQGCLGSDCQYDGSCSGPNCVQTGMSLRHNAAARHSAIDPDGSSARGRNIVGFNWSYGGPPVEEPMEVTLWYDVLGYYSLDVRAAPFLCPYWICDVIAFGSGSIASLDETTMAKAIWNWVDEEKTGRRPLSSLNEFESMQAPPSKNFGDSQVPPESYVEGTTMRRVRWRKTLESGVLYLFYLDLNTGVSTDGMLYGQSRASTNFDSPPVPGSELRGVTMFALDVRLPDGRVWKDNCEVPLDGGSPP